MSAHESAVDRLRRRLTERAPRRIAIPDFQEAAVAVLLVDRDGTTHVPFTVRANHLPKHSGQISFPGGKLDPTDRSHAACALRESNEELGIDPARVRVLGELDDVPTPTGYTIRPIVAELAPDGAVYTPNPGEVDAVFERPLSLFSDPGIREDLGEREFRGVKYRLHAYHVGEDRAIWGATARMLEQLVALLG